MAVGRAYSVALVGVEGHLVDVEADLVAGLPGFTLVGLPDAALAEARDRVRSALVNAGEAWPQKRLTAGLSPAALPKRGTGYDVALALAVLAGEALLPQDALDALVVLGELGLDGAIKPIRGVLPAVAAARRAGFGRVVVPVANAAEARLLRDVDVVPAGHLRALVAWLRGQADDAVGDAPADKPGEPVPVATATAPDLADLRGQPMGRLAAEVAAAGGHHLFLLGPPGAGKTMLAERLPGLLPPLDETAALEVTAVHSVAGVLPAGCPLLLRPPFQSPHHTASVAAVVGGGGGIARPGLVSLAHRGVLFLDEAPEFNAGVLDALRQPLESGEVVLCRAAATARYPARFTLVLAANPCPCAAARQRGRACECPPSQRRRYLAKLSGPLLDRIDLRVVLEPVARADLDPASGSAESTATVAARVAAARQRAQQRLSGTPWRTNGAVPGPDLRRRWPVESRALARAYLAVDQGRLTARGLDATARVAWTLADLAGRRQPGDDEVLLALELRGALAA